MFIYFLEHPIHHYPNSHWCHTKDAPELFFALAKLLLRALALSDVVEERIIILWIAALVSD